MALLGAAPQLGPTQVNKDALQNALFTGTAPYPLASSVTRSVAKILAAILLSSNLMIPPRYTA